MLRALKMHFGAEYICYFDWFCRILTGIELNCIRNEFLENGIRQKMPFCGGNVRIFCQKCRLGGECVV